MGKKWWTWRLFDTLTYIGPDFTFVLILHSMTIDLSGNTTHVAIRLSTESYPFWSGLSFQLITMAFLWMFKRKFRIRGLVSDAMFPILPPNLKSRMPSHCPEDPYTDWVVHKPISWSSEEAGGENSQDNCPLGGMHCFSKLVAGSQAWWGLGKKPRSSFGVKHSINRTCGIIAIFLLLIKFYVQC